MTCYSILPPRELSSAQCNYAYRQQAEICSTEDRLTSLNCSRLISLPVSKRYVYPSHYIGLINNSQHRMVYSHQSHIRLHNRTYVILWVRKESTQLCQLGSPVDDSANTVNIHCKPQSHLSAGNVGVFKTKTITAHSAPFSIQKHDQSPKPMG